MILREYMQSYEEELRRHQRNDILIRDIQPYMDSPSTNTHYKNNPVNDIYSNGNVPLHHEFLITVAVKIYNTAIAKGSSVNGALLVLSQACLESGWGKTARDHMDYNLFGVMGQPSKRRTSHGTIKDYSDLGGYQEAIDDYFDNKFKQWPDIKKVIASETFTADDIDKAFNTGKYYPTEKERFNGKYAYEGKSENEESAYGSKLISQLKSTQKRFILSLEYQVEANRKELESLARSIVLLEVDKLELMRDLNNQNNVFNIILNEIKQ